MLANGYQGAKRLRLVVVQTQSVWIPEVTVLHTLLETLASVADSQGTKLDVLLFQGVDGQVDRGFEPEISLRFRAIPNVRVHPVPVGRLGRWDIPALGRVMKVRDLTRFQIAKKQLFAEARSFRPDLVYSSEQRWDVRLATPLARHLDCAQIMHLHCTVAPWLGRATLDALRHVQTVITVSEFIREQAIRQGVPADRAHTLYNSVTPPAAPSSHTRSLRKRELCAELTLPGHSVLVGMTARICDQKGQAELTQAMVPILLRDPRVHLILAGREMPAGTGVAERIMRIAEAHGVLHRVHLLGHRTDVPRILDALDVFAHPSREEGLGLAVLEASAHGLPTVAWRDGGIPEVVLSGETGLLVEPMDIEALSDALRVLIANDAFRMDMGRKARERVRTVFSPDAAAVRFLSLLKTATGRAALAV